MNSNFHAKLSRTLFGLSGLFFVATTGWVIWNFQYAERMAMRAEVYREAERDRLKEHTKKMAELEQTYRQQEEDILKWMTNNVSKNVYDKFV
ncbi:hypothetical protein KP79_PYT10179 [Mizuhopecten yessoensis]|uniref:Uncharacterized protein n=1 Tax=Mizuhopecten yessoensis TaxID=6573 RepID=A0A210Q523_MIZYE|nr:hypothetical protein KP79_PYT10179 [Mizuhopecten yessoensis]